MQSNSGLGCDVMRAPRSSLHTHRGFAEFCPTQECAPSSLLCAMTGAQLLYRFSLFHADGQLYITLVEAPCVASGIRALDISAERNRRGTQCERERSNIWAYLGLDCLSQSRLKWRPIRSRGQIWQVRLRGGLAQSKHGWPKGKMRPATSWNH